MSENLNRQRGPSLAVEGKERSMMRTNFVEDNEMWHRKSYLNAFHIVYPTCNFCCTWMNDITSVARKNKSLSLSYFWQCEVLFT